MQQLLPKTNSKKWVDYSDESEESAGSDGEHHTHAHHPKPKPRQQETTTPSTQTDLDHRTPEYKQLQLKLIKQTPPYHKDVWVELRSEDQKNLDKKILQYKDLGHEDISLIYINNDKKGTWDVKVKKTLAEKWIKDGLDEEKKIRVLVAERNFKPRQRGQERTRERNDRGGRRGGDDRRGGDRRGGRGGGHGGDRGDRGDREERRGGGRGRGRGDREGGQGGERRGRGDRDEKGEKKSYVDKETGKAPSNKVDCEQKVIVQKERHYTRREAEKVGLQLGNFRNKPKQEVKAQDFKEEEEITSLQKVETESPKKREVWTRKERNEQAEELPKEKKQRYAEKKPEEGDPSKDDKKKKYVRVDKVTEEEKDDLKLKKPLPPTGQESNKKELLSEDSN